MTLVGIRLEKTRDSGGEVLGFSVSALSDTP